MLRCLRPRHAGRPARGRAARGFRTEVAGGDRPFHGRLPGQQASGRVGTERSVRREVSLGSVSASEQTMSAALATPVAEARTYVQQQAVVHADETGWREDRKRAWLWIAGTTLVTVFLVHTKRGARPPARCWDICRHPGDGSVGRYNGWAPDKRQLCWAHYCATSLHLAVEGNGGQRRQGAGSPDPQAFSQLVSSTRWDHDPCCFRAKRGALRIDIELLLKQGVSCHARRWRACAKRS